MGGGFWSGLARRLMEGLEEFTSITSIGNIEAQGMTVIGTGFRHNDIAATAFRETKLMNGSAGATVKGYIYSQGNGADPMCIGAVAQFGDVYNAASGKVYWICTGGGVAPAAEDFFVPLREGDIVEVYSDGATTMDQYIDMPPALGTNGQGTPAAGATIGQTIGMCHDTIGGAGLVKITVGRFWS